MCCPHCQKEIELDELIVVTSRHYRVSNYFFHPQCFIDYCIKLYEPSKKKKGHLQERRKISSDLRYLHRAYYKLADKEVKTDIDLIRMYRYRTKSKLLIARLNEIGGPFADQGQESILREKPIWLEDDELYAPYEAPDITGIIGDTIKTSGEQKNGPSRDRDYRTPNNDE